MTGFVLHTLDTHCPNPPNASLRVHRLARLQKPDHHRPNPHRHPGRRIQRRLLPRLRAVASRIPPPLPAVHLDYRGYFAPRRLRCHCTISTHTAPADVVFFFCECPRKATPKGSIPKHSSHGDELRRDRFRCPQRGYARFSQ